MMAPRALRQLRTIAINGLLQYTGKAYTRDSIQCNKSCQWHQCAALSPCLRTKARMRRYVV